MSSEQYIGFSIDFPGDFCQTPNLHKLCIGPRLHLQSSLVLQDLQERKILSTWTLWMDIWIFMRIFRIFVFFCTLGISQNLDFQIRVFRRLDTQDKDFETFRFFCFFF